jgi:hypothetical protein
LSFDRAYHLASPGQVVEVAGGTYPAQSVTSDPSKTSASDVVFQPAAGASVSFSGRFTVAASHLALKGLHFHFAPTGSDRSLMVEACSDDVTFDQTTGEVFSVLEGTSNITFSGGSWGGYGLSTPGQFDSAIGTAGGSGPARSCNGAIAPPAHNIVIDGVHFHDVFWDAQCQSGCAQAAAPAHPDCFEIDGYQDGVTIKNSTFTRCFATFMQINPDGGPIKNLTIENNSFQDLGRDSYWGIQISCMQPATCGNIVFRNNSYVGGTRAADGTGRPLLTRGLPMAGYSPIQVTNNIFDWSPDAYNCTIMTGPDNLAVWDHNIFHHTVGADAPCGTNASITP